MKDQEGNAADEIQKMEPSLSRSERFDSVLLFGIQRDVFLVQSLKLVSYSQSVSSLKYLSYNFEMNAECDLWPKYHVKCKFRTNSGFEFAVCRIPLRLTS